MKSKRAFTLIELLVVIAIIAILAAILFPVFAQAKDAAKKTVSMSNMRQVGTAMALYMSDSGDTTPPLYYLNTSDLSLPSTGGFYYWPVLLLPYTKSESIFICPKDTDDDPMLIDASGRGRFDRNNSLHHYIVGANPSYGLNYRYMNERINAPDPNGNNPSPFYYVGKSATALESTANTLAFAESTMKDRARPGGGIITSSIGYSRVEPPSYWTGTAPAATAQGQLWPRFNKSLVNVGWLDGHVKTTPMSKLATAGDVYWNGRGQ